MRASVLLAIMIFCLNIFGGIADAADIENGKIVFKRCVACHNADKPDNKIGPTLQHIIGRQAGSLEGYRFSPAMVNAGKEGLLWNRDTLINYLHSPQTMVKGTRMASIRLTNENDIDDLIAYLNSVSSSGNEQ
ncbi:c-type cytochrome [uncultured Bartonella sp.]|uniref:c-type cytochrome n=1 Tax=uncultured Bartonella sp. TaxID=104108 RepID=UPI002601EF98|nr:c-type cytochrome [uncultured Bartonella sp.]